MANILETHNNLIKNIQYTERNAQTINGKDYRLIEFNYIYVLLLKNIIIN